MRQRQKREERRGREEGGGRASFPSCSFPSQIPFPCYIEMPSLSLSLRRNLSLSAGGNASPKLDWLLLLLFLSLRPIFTPYFIYVLGGLGPHPTARLTCTQKPTHSHTSREDCQEFLGILHLTKPAFSLTIPSKSRKFKCNFHGIFQSKSGNPVPRIARSFPHVPPMMQEVMEARLKDRCPFFGRSERGLHLFTPEAPL